MLSTRLLSRLFLACKLWYDMWAIETALWAVGFTLLYKGGDAVSVFEALSLMFLFGMFILALLSYLRKK
ncbi:putative holin-like toxin [Paenibacillus alvei]|uniref:putative holin-like toxin n=1 Tax=Paenibacillus alvei TaxID=44250 RepID=UPI00398FA5D0